MTDSIKLFDGFANETSDMSTKLGTLTDEVEHGNHIFNRFADGNYNLSSKLDMLITAVDNVSLGDEKSGGIFDEDVTSVKIAEMSDRL